MLLAGTFAFRFRPWQFFFALLFGAIPFSAQSQAPATTATPPPAEAKEPATPYTIELLETRVRIESDGASRQETHTIILISSESAAGQFGRLTFDYDRSRESLDFPLLRITHPGGGTADILPSAISDQAHPAVAAAPAFQDVRRKSVRILGLRTGDRLEYRVVTTIRRAAMAPEFSFSHTFTRSAIVSRELLELDVPAGRAIQLRVSPSLPAAVEETGEGESARRIHRWSVTNAAGDGDKGEAELTVTSFASWEQLSTRFAHEFFPEAAAGGALREKSAELLRGTQSGEEKLQAIYDFVSRKIRTVDLPLGTAGFSPRGLEAILSSGYATSEEKAALLTALSEQAGLPAHPVLMTESVNAGKALLPAPPVVSRILVKAGEETAARWMDPAAEVAPLGMVHASLRGKQGLVIATHPDGSAGLWVTAPLDLPFAARQQVRVDATLGEDGKLNAKVRYALRGDNELLLRVAFHQTPKERWNELAQMLSLADGFRGQITGITASDPTETHSPFTLGYEIPALLPQAGLPELPANGAAGAAIELGTPLEVETTSTIHLPSSRTFGASAWSVRKPLGMTVKRDYAAFASRYALEDSPAGAERGRTLTASRHLTFVLRQIAATRAADYASLVRAVQNDEAQAFTLERAAAGGAGARPAGRKAPPRKPGKAARPANP
ncbi:MAG: DUF3857 domain-containing protein [Acidobacteriia bacterium]|nr:DUF3857 domain-containing protein [Terriglobia bacterium]